jgi:hypothetical protein
LTSDEYALQVDSEKYASFSSISAATDNADDLAIITARSRLPIYDDGTLSVIFFNLRFTLAGATLSEYIAFLKVSLLTAVRACCSSARQRSNLHFLHLTETLVLMVEQLLHFQMRFIIAANQQTKKQPMKPRRPRTTQRTNNHKGNKEYTQQIQKEQNLQNGQKTT